MEKSLEIFPYFFHAKKFPISRRFKIIQREILWDFIADYFQQVCEIKYVLQ